MAYSRALFSSRSSASSRIPSSCRMMARTASLVLRGSTPQYTTHGPAVAEVVDGTAHIVGQAVYFPQVQEQAAAHAVAQHNVQQAEGVAVGVVERQPGQGEAEVGLVGAASFQLDDGTVAIGLCDGLPVQ